MKINNFIESDGDLFEMQKEAIRRAKETAARTQFPEQEVKGISFGPRHVERHSDKNCRKEQGIGGLFKNLLGNFKADDLILIALFFLLINEDADDDILLLIVLLFVLGLG